MTVTVQVEGLKALQAVLRALPRATARDVMLRVLEQRAKPIAAHAARLAPVDQGDLQESIQVSTRLTQRQRGLHRKDGPRDVEVFVGAGPQPQAHLQEFGAEQHPPQPFMRPAWDSEKDRLLEGIAEDLWAEIQVAGARR